MRPTPTNNWLETNNQSLRKTQGDSVGFNVDNLYSFAVVDMSDEPIVMSVPEMGDRYWIMQVIDAWNGDPCCAGITGAMAVEGACSS